MSGNRYKVADEIDFPDDGSRVIAEVGGKEIAVFCLNGEYHAILNFCVHQGGPLCEGELTGEMIVGDDGWEWLYEDGKQNITCPWHGWKFDVTTGKNIQDERYTVPRYEVEVTDGDVYVVV